MYWPFLAIAGTLQLPTSAPPPIPQPEVIEIIELPLPPVSSNNTGACASINPNQTGCIAKQSKAFQAGDFTPDGNHIAITVEFVGAPEPPHPSSIYTNTQLILVKINGTFHNGDSWKCLTCTLGLSSDSVPLNPSTDYPHITRNSLQALWGQNLVDCNGLPLTSDECTPDQIRGYPIHWAGGSPREMRMHPDDTHMGWSAFTTGGGGQNSFYGRLQFNASIPRYELVEVNLLPADAPIRAFGSELRIQQAITIGELRGFSGSGDEIVYIGSPSEANNIDLFAVHLGTGIVRRLTSHPEYGDPISFSYDDEWFVTMDTRGSDRQMWMAGLRYVPPLIDLVAVTGAASTRNNGARRFFQPFLIDRFGDRGDYFGQRVNDGDVDGGGEPGSVNDPDWNGRADPAFSPDGTSIVYWQSLVTAPACGGENPLPCPISTAQGGRNYRVMLARLGRKPTAPAPVFAAPDHIPWAMPFPAGARVPTPYTLPGGNYTLYGKTDGLAKVALIKDPTLDAFKTVSVNYTNYSDDGMHFINGYESVTRTLSVASPWLNHLDWLSDIVQTGAVHAVKKTGPGGFHMSIDALENIFEANGTLTTTIDGTTYHQPLNHG